MPCNLVILGKNLDLDSCIKKNKLRGYSKTYKGEPIYKSKPNGEKVKYSFISVQTSKADFRDLKKQISDTIKYMKRHRDKLSFIKSTKEIEYAFLDFGVALKVNKKMPAHFDYYPNSLILLAGQIGLGLHISLYSIEK